MGHFLLFSKYKQKLPFCYAFLPPEKVKKEDFNRHHFVPQISKKYVKIKLMQNETNCWSIFL